MLEYPFQHPQICFRMEARKIHLLYMKSLGCLYNFLPISQSAKYKMHIIQYGNYIIEIQNNSRGIYTSKEIWESFSCAEIQ